MLCSQFRGKMPFLQPKVGHHFSNQLIPHFILTLSIPFDFIWFHLIWFDLIWFDLIWFDLISFHLISLSEYARDLPQHQFAASYLRDAACLCFWGICNYIPSIDESYDNARIFFKRKVKYWIMTSHSLNLAEYTLMTLMPLCHRTSATSTPRAQGSWCFC